MLVLLGLAVGSVAFWRAGPGHHARRGGIALAVGAAPTFGAFAGHLIPLVRRGSVEPASETATFNLGGGAMLLVLGASLLLDRSGG